VRRLFVALLLPLGACGGLPEDSARTLDADSYIVTESTMSPAPPLPPDDAALNIAAVVYLIRGEGLVSRGRVIDPDPPLDSVLSLLVAGPTTSETELGFRSGLTNRGDLILDSRIDDGVAYVSLSDEVDSFSGNEQILILGQIVLTSLTVPNVSAVVFLRMNEPLSVIAPNGSSLSGPISRSDFSVLLTR